MFNIPPMSSAAGGGHLFLAASHVCKPFKKRPPDAARLSEAARRPFDQHQQRLRFLNFTGQFRAHPTRPLAALIHELLNVFPRPKSRCRHMIGGLGASVTCEVFQFSRGWNLEEAVALVYRCRWVGGWGQLSPFARVKRKTLFPSNVYPYLSTTGKTAHSTPAVPLPWTHPL